MLRSDTSPRISFLSYCLLTLTLALVLACVSPAFGQMTILVDRTDDLGFIAACDDAVPDDCTLRGAINLANVQPLGTDVVVELAAATYELTLNGANDDANAFGDLDILRDMTLRGQGRSATTISGGEMSPLDDRLLEVHGPDHTVTFESLTFAFGAPPSGLHSVFVAGTNTVTFENCGFVSHGDAVTGGGALRLGFGVTSATLVDCLFEHNATDADGAAISSGAHELGIVSSNFNDNMAGQFGGALRLEPPAPGVEGLTILALSSLHDNQALQGGAVWAGQFAKLIVAGSTLRDNQATLAAPIDRIGGAIYSRYDLDVAYSTFSGNGADQAGAAIYSDSSVPQAVVDIFNSTFSANLGIGGDVEALHLENSAAELLHVTMAQQTIDIATDQADLALQNSLFGSGCTIVLGTTQSNGGNVAVNPSCWAGAPAASDVVAADLELEPLAAAGGLTWTHVPGPASPARGASPVCPPAPSTDQRELERPATDCDSGSVQRQPNEGPLVFVDDFESGDLGAWSVAVP